MKGTTFKIEAREYPTDEYEIYIGDVNGDGKEDVIACFLNKSALKFGLYYNIYLSTGMGFEKYDTLVDNYPWIPTEKWKKLVSIIDAGGTGVEKILWKDIEAPHFTVIKHLFRYDNPNLFVTDITNGLNQKISFSYRPLTDSLVYTRTAKVTYPLVGSAFPLYVVANMRSTDNFGKIFSSLSFQYQNIRTHIQGRGFLGFGMLYMRDSLLMQSQIKEYSIGNGYDVYLSSVTTNAIKAGTEIPVSKITSETLYRNYGNNRYFPFVYQEKKIDYLQSLTQSTTYDYDTDHGNIKRTIELRGNLLKTTEFVWEAKDNIFKNCLTERKETLSGGEGNDFVTVTRYSYDAKGRLSSQTDYSGTEKAVTVTYSDYDVFGNPQTETKTASGCDAIVTKNYYGDKGRFLEKSEDALGNESEYQYDHATGNVLRKAGSDGLVTDYTYDNWGNAVSEITPGGLISTFSRKWDLSGSAYPQALYTDIATYTGIEGAERTWYDGQGREIARHVPGFGNNAQGAGKYIVIRKSYYDNGRLKSESYPIFYGNGVAAPLTEYTYDEFGRVLSKNDRGLVTGYTYITENRETKTTYPDGTTSKTILNSAGLTQSVTDAAGGSVTYTYNSMGKPVTVTANGIAMTVAYDYRGYRVSLKDPNQTGNISYNYDAYGRLASETNARDSVTSYQYDVLGRKIKMVRGGETFAYEYVTSGNGKGQLSTVKKGNSVVRRYEYDAYGNIVTDTETFDGVQYVRRYAYDDCLRIKEKCTPSGLQLVNTYDKVGYLTEIRNKEDNALIWRMEGMNASEQITRSTQGNGLSRVSVFDSYDYLSSLTLYDGDKVVDRMVLAFDSLTGNLKSRNDITNGRNEVFGYDNLKRLTSIRLNNEGINSVVYESNGNIESKYNVGSYKYEKDRPHAVSFIENRVSGYNPSDVTFKYNSFNRVIEIKEPGATMKKAQFVYGYDNERRKMQYYENDVLKRTRYYFGNYEKETAGSVTREFDYIYSPEGLVAVADKTGSARKIRYIHTDHLGSIRRITDATKQVLARYYYDAWGVRTLAEGSDVETRGYTGHEHLSAFGLINMNARVYDPVLARFLGIDPVVQFPDFTQNYNGYAYGLNNPLSYIDPEGESVLLACLIAGGVAAGLGGLQGYQVAKAKGATGWKMFGYILGGGLIGAGSAVASVFTAGAVTGLVGGALGSGALGGAVSGAASGAVGGFLSGTGMGFLGGAKVGEAFKMGAIGMGLGAAGGAVIGGVAQGVSSIKGGGDFWKGIRPKSDIVMPHIEEIEKPIQKLEAINQTVEVGTIGSGNRGNALYHYTTEKGYNAIMSSKEILPSIGEKNARHGYGQYFTDISPQDYTAGQVSRRLYRVPWNTEKLRYYIKVDLNGLDVRYNGPHNYLVPGTNSLPIENRVVDHGLSIFKIKF
ncbi:MAG: HYD1 signature containing ADP-ribosyltransferase family protein [Bacteroidales bacterium]|nr:HYD1 signature containing ADP-ribosyltransferase family protein [Bacteroidales bacterium]